MGRRHCFDVFLMRRGFQHGSLMEVLILPEQLIYRNLSLCAEQQSAIKYNRASLRFVVVQLFKYTLHGTMTNIQLSCHVRLAFKVIIQQILKNKAD